MPLLRSTEQQRCTLEEFYQEVEQNPNFHLSIGAGMLVLLKELNDIFKETVIWGLTSHFHLLLMNVDYPGAKHYVRITSGGLGEYYLEYAIPVDQQPWPDAFVKGEAKSLEQAVNYVLIGLRESRGWLGNNELEIELAKRKL